jgi:hypothetical protein
MSYTWVLAGTLPPGQWVLLPSVPPAASLLPPGNGLLPPGNGLLPPGNGLLPPGNGSTFAPSPRSGAHYPHLSLAPGSRLEKKISSQPPAAISATKTGELSR